MLNEEVVLEEHLPGIHCILLFSKFVYFLVLKNFSVLVKKAGGCVIEGLNNHVEVYKFIGF